MSSAVANGVKVQEVVSDVESDSGSEISAVEHVHGPDCNHEHDGDRMMVLNRNEKKARKILMKLGLKPIEGIERVTIKRARNMIFAISNPEVYKNGDNYIVFGEAKIEDPALQAQALAAQRLAQSSVRPPTASKAAESKTAQVVEEEEEEGEEESADGVDPKDIEIVMEQASVSRNKAIKTLKANNNDIVNSIMELTM